jgi:hypothetical protein
MPLDLSIGTYDPCPCGSGAKYKFCCAAKAKQLRHGRYPIGTVNLYGPDDQTTTKIAASVILQNAAQPVLERFLGPNVVNDPAIQDQIKRLFAQFGVKSVVVSDRNMGCPHEEGIDFPLGEDCPLCPFWAGKQGTARRDEEDVSSEKDNDDSYNFGPQTGADADPAAAQLSVEDQEAVARIDALLRDKPDYLSRLEFLSESLQANLKLPCLVSGTDPFISEDIDCDDFGSDDEYECAKKLRPWHVDQFELLGIDGEAFSNWMLHDGEIGAYVRRVSDGRMFCLGLSELKPVDPDSPNHQLIADYAMWFMHDTH